MRTRKEIEEDRKNQSEIVQDFYPHRIEMEVLLDIRDLLNELAEVQKR